MPDFGETIATAYAVDGGTIDLGRGVHEGALVPDAVVQVPLAMMNRHGLVAGATGTGKTKTIQGIAEQLSAAGVPVFVADVKGDLSGLAAAGDPGGPAEKRMADLGLPYEPAAFPVEFLALGGIGPGVPVRATVTDFGPQLLAKILDANETQEQSLALVFRFADERGLPLLDISDLRALLTHLDSDQGKEELRGIGGVSSQTIGVLLRALVAVEDGGGTEFFGEPQLEIADLLRIAPDGRGIVTCLELPAIQDKPRLWSTALMWLLAELFEELPEVGDLEKPKLVFFFDEAHLLFSGATDAFVESVVTDRPDDPLEGGRCLLLDPGAEGRPRGRPGSARQPDPARSAGVHAERREGAESGDLDLSEVRVLRPRGAAAVARHRRGGGDDSLGGRRSDPGRPHEDAGTRVSDGARPTTSRERRRPRRSSRSTAPGSIAESARERLAARLEAPEPVSQAEAPKPSRRAKEAAKATRAAATR